MPKQIWPAQWVREIAQLWHAVATMMALARVDTAFSRRWGKNRGRLAELATMVEAFGRQHYDVAVVVSDAFKELSTLRAFVGDVVVNAGGAEPSLEEALRVFAKTERGGDLIDELYQERSREQLFGMMAPRADEANRFAYGFTGSTGVYFMGGMGYSGAARTPQRNLGVPIGVVVRIQTQRDGDRLRYFADIQSHSAYGGTGMVAVVETTRRLQPGDLAYSEDIVNQRTHGVVAPEEVAASRFVQDYAQEPRQRLGLAAQVEAAGVPPDEDDE